MKKRMPITDTKKFSLSLTNLRAAIKGSHSDVQKTDASESGSVTAHFSTTSTTSTIYASNNTNNHSLISSNSNVSSSSSSSSTVISNEGSPRSLSSTTSSNSSSPSSTSSSLSNNEGSPRPLSPRKKLPSSLKMSFFRSQKFKKEQKEQLSTSLPYTPEERTACLRFAEEKVNRPTKNAIYKENMGLLVCSRFYEYKCNDSISELIITFTKSNKQSIVHAVFAITNHCISKKHDGEVLIGYDLSGNTKVAIKKLPTFSLPSEAQKINKEGDHLAQMGKLLAFCSRSEEIDGVVSDIIFLVMRYAPGKNLTEYLYELNTNHQPHDPYYMMGKRLIDPFTQLLIIINLANEVDAIHQRYIHRDLNPNNVRIEPDLCTVEIVDYGETITIQRSELDKRFCSTGGYGPPEVLSEKNNKNNKREYTIQSDFFSLGVMILEILTKNNYKSACNEKASKTKFSFSFIMTRDEILSIMSDVLVCDDKLIHDFSLLGANISEIDHFIYITLIQPQLVKFILSLIEEKPENRLKGSSLKAEITRLVEMQIQWKILREKLLVQAQSITELQHHVNALVLNSDSILFDIRVSANQIKQFISANKKVDVANRDTQLVASYQNVGVSPHNDPHGKEEATQQQMTQSHQTILRLS